jgi:hypothetical protein
MYLNAEGLHWVHFFQFAVDERSFSITIASITITKARNGLHAETFDLQVRVMHAEWSLNFYL